MVKYEIARGKIRVGEDTYKAGTQIELTDAEIAGFPDGTLKIVGTVAAPVVDSASGVSDGLTLGDVTTTSSTSTSKKSSAKSE